MKAYIFDMDGTIVNNCGDHTKAWVEFSRRHGNELSERDIIAWMGAQGSYYIERIFNRRLPDAEVARLCAEKEALYRSIYHPVAPEGFREMLAAAKNQGISFALATGGPHENVDFILDNLQLRQEFEVIIDATMYKKSKPDPECFLAAAARLGVEPSECRVYEDAVNGILAAKAAGMEVHAVTFTNPRSVLLDAGADFVFDNYRECL